MSHGVITKSASGTTNLYSPSLNASFFRGATTLVNSATVQDTAFSNTFAVATPLSPVYYYDNGELGNSFNISGYTPYSGQQFNQPGAIGTSSAQGVGAPAIYPQSTYVHYFGTPPESSSYGFRAKGANSTSLAIDNQHKALYIQPDSNGAFIRYATATSLPSLGTSQGTGALSFTQNTSQNIYFNRAYTNPPLIFITQSDGYIAMNYMIRDGNGQYVGASITAESSFSTPNQASGTGAYAGNSYGFKYFLVSEEQPTYAIQSSQWGMKVFDGGGSEVFNSSYFVPSFLTSNLYTPYMAMNPYYYYNINSTNRGFIGKMGVCINNFNSITGYTAYVAQRFLIYGTYYGTGPLNFHGRYIQVYEGAYVAIKGAGSLAGTRIWYRALSGQNTTASYEVTGNTGGFMDITFAKYEY